MGEGGEREVRKHILTFAAISTAACATHAKTADVATDPVPETQIDTWCSKLIKSKRTTDFLDGFQININLLRKLKDATGINKPWNLLVETYGAPQSCEKISLSAVGQRFVTHRVLVHHESFATNWHLTFYRDAKGWKLISFNFSDSPDKDFDPANSNAYSVLSDLPDNSTT
jgi:hypothetical protein